MSWTDYKSIQQMIKFRDIYNISTFVETGTFRGVNAEVHAKNFEKVFTCELLSEYYDIATNRLSKYENVYQALESSNLFLSKIKLAYENHNETLFIYLDAHFYDSNLKPEDRWVVIKELKYLYGYNKCVIAIHDFDNGELGHLVYDGQPLNFELLKEHLHNVNPHFNYYTNTKNGCDIVTEKSMKEYYPHVEIDDDTIDTLKYVWSSEQKTYRGILYCSPFELDLQEFELRKL